MSLCFRKGLLIDSSLLNNFTDKEIDTLIEVSRKLNLKYLDLEAIEKNKLKIIEYLSSLNIEKSFIDSFKDRINFSEEKEVKEEIKKEKNFFQPFKKEISVNDFVDFYRFRFNYLKEILKERKELENLISIDKLTSSNRKVSVIGMVYEKRETKNGNIILTLEDNKASVNVLVGKDKEVYKKAQNVVEDEVIGVKGFGKQRNNFCIRYSFSRNFKPKPKRM